MKSVHDEVEKTRAHLRRCVEGSGLSLAEVARRSQVPRSSLARLLREDGAWLRADRMWAVLESVGVRPRDFFRQLYFPDEVAG
jgi:transcriptional regulator with XRE-family HTH domain